MRVALIHDFLTSYTGAERLVKVLADMYPDAPIFTLLYDKERMGEIFPPKRVRPSFLQRLPGFIRKRRRILLPLFPTAVEKFDLTDFDLIISSSNAWTKGVVTRVHSCHICYCHSPMRFAWDWTHEYQKEHALHGLKGLITSYLLNKIRIWDAISAHRVDHFIANSNTVRGRIEKYYRTSADVIYPPVDLDRFLGKKTVDNGYYFIVSRLEPYKRIHLAIEAVRDMPDKRLIIVGEGSAKRQLERLTRGANNIQILGNVSDDEVDELYANCHAFLFPGEDDFGLTPVEAMACGKPVVAIAAGGALETVVHGKTGYFFNEPTVASLSSALKKLETDYDKFDSDKIREHSRQFSKDAFVSNFQRLVVKLLADDKENIVHSRQDTKHFSCPLPSSTPSSSCLVS